MYFFHRHWKDSFPNLYGKHKWPVEPKQYLKKEKSNIGKHWPILNHYGKAAGDFPDGANDEESACQWGMVAKILALEDTH